MHVLFNAGFFPLVFFGVRLEEGEEFFAVAELRVFGDAINETLQLCHAALDHFATLALLASAQPQLELDETVEAFAREGR